MTLTTYDEWLIAWRHFLSDQGPCPSLEHLSEEDKQAAISDMGGWAYARGKTMGYVSGLRKDGANDHKDDE